MWNPNKNDYTYVENFYWKGHYPVTNAYPLIVNSENFYLKNYDESLVKLEKARFYTIAKDSKIQITFDATMVDSYRLIGYENRSLDSSDFVNDTIDAGEIGSSQTITAMYEVILNNTNMTTPQEEVF